MDRYKEIHLTYENEFDLSTLNGANDRLNLETLIRNTVLLERLDHEIKILMDGADIINAVVTIDKISRVKDNIAAQNVTIERQLGIDRKSRKKDNETSAAEYIIALKQNAREFLEKRLTKVYCSKCKILVMRFSAAYDHGEYRVTAQCPQCNNVVVAHRKERDVFFDLAPRDREWRKKYPIEIVNPKEQKEVSEDTIYDDALVIDDTSEDNT
jgi:hypothetical protein